MQENVITSLEIKAKQINISTETTKLIKNMIECFDVWLDLHKNDRIYSMLTELTIFQITINSCHLPGLYEPGIKCLKNLAKNIKKNEKYIPLCEYLIICCQAYIEMIYNNYNEWKHD